MAMTSKQKIADIVRRMRAGLATETASILIQQIYVEELGLSPQNARALAIRTLGPPPGPTGGEIGQQMFGGGAPFPGGPPGGDVGWPWLNGDEDEVPVNGDEVPFFGGEVPFPGGEVPANGDEEPLPIDPIPVEVNPVPIPEDPDPYEDFVFPPGLSDETLSEDWRGRQELFSRYMAALPTSLAPFAKRVFTNRFAPLEAQWGMGSPGEGGNFADYLRGNPMFDPQAFGQSVQAIGSMWDTARDDLSPAQETLIEQLRAQSETTGRADFARNVMSQGMLAGISPFLRRKAAEVLQNRFSRWRGANPFGDIFGAYIKKGYKL
jgi:hypothetical protein